MAGDVYVIWLHVVEFTEEVFRRFSRCIRGSWLSRCFVVLVGAFVEVG